jgi:Na+/proline symporter
MEKPKSRTMLSDHGRILLMSEILIFVVATNIILMIFATILTRFKIFSEARAMTAPVFALTLIPAFYMDLGTSFQIETIASEGLAQWWYYAASWYPAYVLGIIFAGLIRSTGVHLTLPDRLSQYGQLAEFLSAIVSYLYLMPLGSIFAIGIILSLLTGYTVPIWATMLIAGIILSLFTAEYGWSGYSITGLIYFLVMAFGIGVTCITMINVAGGWSTIRATLPESYFHPWFTEFGGFIQGLRDPATLLWFLMGFSFIIDPMVWQRFSLTENEDAARKGMLFAFIFYLLFDLTTVGSGLALATLGGEYYVDTAFEMMPEVAGGLMISGVLLAAIAGNSAYLHSGGLIFSQNIAKAIGLLSWDALQDDKEAREWYKKGVYLLGALGTIIIIILNSLMPEDPVTTAWLIQSGILFGGLAVPVIVGGVLYREKIPPESIEYGILLGLVTTILSIIGGFLYPNYTGVITLGITPETATGTPLIDASRVLGFCATIIGMILGYIINKIRD